MGVSWQESVYFTTVTWSTVGYGDITPHRDLTKLFGIVFIIVGLSLVAEVVAQGVGSFAEGIRKQVNQEVDSQKEKPFLDVLMPFLQWSVALFVLLAFGTAVFCYLENWSLIDGLWWAVATTTTVGYGDLVLKHEKDFLFDSLFIIVGVPIMAGYLTSITRVSAFFFQRYTQTVRMRSPPSIQSVQNMVGNARKNEFSSGRGISDGEFLMHFLVGQDLLPQKQCELILKMHEKLDSNGGGSLSSNDLLAFQRSLEIDQGRPGTVPVVAVPSRQSKSSRGVNRKRMDRGNLVEMGPMSLHQRGEAIPIRPGARFAHAPTDRGRATAAQGPVTISDIL